MLPPSALKINHRQTHREKTDGCQRKGGEGMIKKGEGEQEVQTST